MGTAEQCEESVKKAKRLWLEWIRVFGLNCRISTATDSFFASNYKKLKLFQILGNSKQEFKRLPSGERYVFGMRLCEFPQNAFHQTV